MLRATAATFAAALAVTVAAGAAYAANLRVLSADCDPSLAATMGQGTPGKICTATTSRNMAGRVSYGAADGAFYPLGLSNGIIFDVDPAFAGGRSTRNATGDVAQGVTAANPSAPGLTRPGATPRAAGIGGSTPAGFPGNGLALGTGLPQTSGGLSAEPIPPLSPLMPTTLPPARRSRTIRNWARRHPRSARSRCRPPVGCCWPALAHWALSGAAHAPPERARFQPQITMQRYGSARPSGERFACSNS